MRIALEALDVRLADDVLKSVNREVTARVASSVFAGVEDVRLRLRRVKGALLCVVAVGFTGGDLVTSTATSDSPLDAIVGALDGLPAHIDRVQKSDRRTSVPTPIGSHAAVREELKRLLASV